jgi:HD-like signal output (HDOD) protein
MKIHSHTYFKIKKLLDNPQASAKDLAKIISRDRDLSERLLRIVNSNYYGFPQRIETITGAIVLLGFDAVKLLFNDH